MQEPEFKKKSKFLIFPGDMYGCKTWTVTQI